MKSLTSRLVAGPYLALAVLLALLAACGGANTSPPTPTVQASTAISSPTEFALGEGGSAPADDTGFLEAPTETVTAGIPTARPSSPALATTSAIAPAPSPQPPTATSTPPSSATPSPLPPTATSTAQPSATPGPPPSPATATLLPEASSTPTRTFSTDPSPLQIEVMRQQSYPGSEITLEQQLAPGANYSRAIVSYRSDGLKIYALMTVPNGPKPATGWPVIVFNHGYIPPAQYRTTERYVAYVDAIARAGYIVFKSDYRGHGSSEGSTQGGGYGAPGYTADVLNAVASLQQYPDADPNRIGMWGHSMGGHLTLRAMVISRDIKAGVIWGGVVAPYTDMLTRWTRRAPPPPIPTNQRRWRQELIAKYGTPDQNPAFWASISPNTFVADLSGPLQLQHSVTDEEVPVAFSATLYDELKAAGKTTEFYTYPGDNHNINANFNTAMARSIAWFDKYVKGANP